MYYFHLLKSSEDNNYYYGSTKDLKKRLNQHNNGGVQSTKSRKPFTLVYYEAYLANELAFERKRIVKRSGTARDAIHKRIGV